MELKQAKALLTELADGVDPLTGECLPADSVCNRPEIIRALHCVLRYVSDRPKGLHHCPMRASRGRRRMKPP